MRAPVNDSMAGESFSARAAAIVRSCVHCGFCNATCPTYQLSGDELEGPRGRIYLIKSLLEEGRAGADTRLHLDQCLLCRSCETTCPSGVNYGELIELVRPEAKAMPPPPWRARLLAWLLVNVIPYRRRFAPLVWAGRSVRGILPRRLAGMLPAARRFPTPATVTGPRRVLLLGGCAQPLLNPDIDAAAALVFARLGITLVNVAGSACCGALSLHLGYREAAVRQARQNIDAWWPAIEAGAEAIMATSSGCGVQLKDYAALLEHEPDYRERAQRLQALVRDPIELVDLAALSEQVQSRDAQPIAFQAPCTLQHGQRLANRVETLLGALGWQLTAVAEPHLCCGSAGSYSILHPRMATELRERKLGALMAGEPSQIVTANIGCQLHLKSASNVPVRHWLELLAENLI